MIIITTITKIKSVMEIVIAITRTIMLTRKILSSLVNTLFFQRFSYHERQASEAISELSQTSYIGLFMKIFND